MTEQELLEELERSIESNNRNNLDLIKVLNGTDTQDVTLQDGSVVPSLSKRVQAEVVEDSNYLFKSDNLASVENKQTARTNLGVPSAIEMNTAITNATPNASEEVAGKAKIATTAIAQEGTNDTDFLTAKKLRNALNATGESPIFAFRASALFNGVGGVSGATLRNISSVERLAVGSYKCNFLTPMTDVNYGVKGTANPTSGVGNGTVIMVLERTVNYFTFFVKTGGSAERFDVNYIYVEVS